MGPIKWMVSKIEHPLWMIDTTGFIPIETYMAEAMIDTAEKGRCIH